MPGVGLVIAVALCTPFAYALHRWFEMPIIDSRTARLGARPACRACARYLQCPSHTCGTVVPFPLACFLAAGFSMPKAQLYLGAAAILAWMAGYLPAVAPRAGAWLRPRRKTPTNHFVDILAN